MLQVPGQIKIKKYEMTKEKAKPKVEPLIQV
jgi:hypothetical protein